MKRGSHSVISGFFLRAILWLVPCLALWYLGRHYVAVAPAWLAEWAMKAIFPFWAQGSELHGTQQVLLTGLTVKMPGGRLADVAPEANVLTYAYGIPLLAALFLGVRAKGWWWKIPVGAVALLPFQAWGVCFTWLGACQGSCRLIHARRGALSSADVGVSMGSESRSGLSLTTAM